MVQVIPAHQHTAVGDHAGRGFTAHFRDGQVQRTAAKVEDQGTEVGISRLTEEKIQSVINSVIGTETGARLITYVETCIHCGLCVRYCAEVKGAHAVGFIDRGVRKEISFVPEIAMQECNDCKECFPLCPTSYLQAAFVLVESLTFE